MTTVSLILILFVYLIFRALLNLERTRKWCKSQLEKADLDFLDPVPAPHFFLIVPALREQKVIVRLLDRLCNLKYPPNKFEIIVALDENERNDSSSKHTVDIVREYAESLTVQQPSLSFVEYSGMERRKANQLNFALSAARDRCRAMQRAEDECFVGVYDADSLPDRRVLTYISWWISNQPNARAFQQILDYRLNLNEIENVRNSRLLKANAYYQTAWNGMFEVPNECQALGTWEVGLS